MHRGEECAEGICTSGGPVDCSALDDQCAVGECDPESGECVAENANEGEECDDGNDCTADEICVEGVCVDEDGDDTLFFEDFADRGAGWTTLFNTPCCDFTVDTSWIYQEHELTAYASAGMQVRWCFDIGSTGVVDSSGWNVDDVAIGPTPCAP